MSENRKKLEDENVYVEYDIINGLVCINKIYLKEAKEAEGNERNLKIGERFTYQVCEKGIEFVFKPVAESSFCLYVVVNENKENHMRVPKLDVLRLIVWHSFEEFEAVELTEAKDGLLVTLTDNFFDRKSREYFTPQFMMYLGNAIKEELEHYFSSGGYSGKYFDEVLEEFKNTPDISYVADMLVKALQ